MKMMMVDRIFFIADSRARESWARNLEEMRAIVPNERQFRAAECLTPTLRGRKMKRYWKRVEIANG